MNFIQFMGALELGLLYGIVAMAVYLTFRSINFPDLTVDGSFPLGAAVASVLIIHDVHPLLASLAALLAGGVAGLVTAFLYVRWRILGLLAGILTMTALYSINLRVMGRPNIALLSERTLFSELGQWLGPNNELWVIAGIAGLVALLLIRFLASDLGLSLRATGVNPQVSRAYGVDIGKMTFLGLAISNALVALAGGLFAQAQGFADISMGASTVITGLASVVIGEAILHTRRVGLLVLGCVLGSILYRLAIAAALNASVLGMQGSDLNLVTAVLVAVTMFVSHMRRRLLRGA